jgi:hypothetical protein
LRCCYLKWMKIVLFIFHLLFSMISLMRFSLFL